jgi:3-phenylpropionate/cinnamic acid dioxygenase small subunit
MDIEELAAREEIRELVTSYTHLGDGGRIDEMLQLFREDAELDAFRTTYIGREGMAGFFGGIANGTSGGPQRSFLRHYISNVTIEVHDENTASGASYYTVIADRGLESSGRYWDTYQRGPEGWRFATRKIRVDESKLPEGG